MSLSAPKTFLVPLREAQAAQSFASVIVRIPLAELVLASDRNIETARLWKRGARCPNVSSLVNLARSFPEVKAWFLAQLSGGM